MTLDLRDRIIQEHAPVVMAPAFGELTPLERPGHRYIAAHDGLWLELRRPWLRLVQPIAPAIALKLPYGEAIARITTTFGKIPRELLVRFLEESRKFAPLEHVAWIVWNDLEQRLEYRDLDVTSMSEAGVRYNRPTLADHESLAIDLHSHGAMAPFFSSTDDEDDAGEVKISGVVGNLEEGAATAEWKFRLCALGIFKDLPGPKDL